MKTTEQKLTDALAQIATLEGQVTSHVAALADADGRKTAAVAKITAHEKTIDTLKADLAAGAKALADQRDAAKELTNKLAAAEAKVTELTAKEQDIEKRAALRAAEIAAASGTPAPSSISSRGAQGDPTVEELKKQFAACKTPAEQTTLWKSFTPAQRAALAATE